MAEEDQNSQPLTRRNFIQAIGLLAAGTATSNAPALPQPGDGAAAGGSPAYVRKVFTAHQWVMVGALCDLIIPADDRSGSATQAQVPKFIDDWIDFRRQQDGNDLLMAQICGGLTWLDAESNRLFTAPFVDAKPSQQHQMLDRIAWPEHVTQEDHRWMLFFSEFRNLTVSGFYSSMVGVADLPYLGNTFVEKWTGCSDELWQIIEQRRRTGYQGIRLAAPTGEAESRGQTGLKDAKVQMR
jgi:gluconate 2-dehydrogenase gamma chain